MMHQVTHPSGETYRTPSNPAQYSAQEQQPPRAAHALGANTEQVLADVLGLDQASIGGLIDRGIVATA
jgi:2-methylfumaryl-CoA isomerase